MSQRNVLMGNRLLHNKSMERSQALHLKKLMEIRSSSNYGSSGNTRANAYANALGFVQPTHELNHKKKEQLLEGRYTEIERENRILLEKITSIMSNTTNNNLHHQSQIHQNAKVSGKNGQTGTMVTTQSQSQQQQSSQQQAASSQNAQANTAVTTIIPPVYPPPRSLNIKLRKKKQLEIMQENSMILRRLKEKKSNYNIQEYENKWFQTKTFINTITGYNSNINNESARRRTARSGSYSNAEQNFDFSMPSKPNPRFANQTMYNHNQQNNHQNDSNFYDPGESVATVGGQARGKTSHRGLSAVSRSSKSNKQRSWEGGVVHASRKLDAMGFERIHREVRSIAGVIFEIEVKLSREVLLISADPIEGDHTKLIEIPREKAIAFIQDECENQISILISKLRLIDDRLSLVTTTTTTTSTTNYANIHDSNAYEHGMRAQTAENEQSDSPMMQTNQSLRQSQEQNRPSSTTKASSSRQKHFHLHSNN